MEQKKKIIGIEENNNIHSKEVYPFKDSDSTATRYAKHSKIDWNMCEYGDKIVDCNKRGKAKDVTGKDFNEEVAFFTE